eukprot:CAMPEP_0181289206 /NCGR_PEP_ID=MMETSP1101-20121128/758_1 /TAXON_ID=46948 /ORGANISM="Rhodomonas abbreviata, Strain Caron Lab Isolate" /LENGTH=343 /DNA_ID=CAMNT_0023393411 /DNA_START=147 /DNA_END=1179 /DNA_ORIENTATION=-
MPPIRPAKAKTLLIEQALLLCDDTPASDRASTWLQKQPALGRKLEEGAENITLPDRNFSATHGRFSHDDKTSVSTAATRSQCRRSSTGSKLLPMIPRKTGEDSLGSFGDITRRRTKSDERPATSGDSSSASSSKKTGLRRWLKLPQTKGKQAANMTAAKEEQPVTTVSWSQRMKSKIAHFGKSTRKVEEDEFSRSGRCLVKEHYDGEEQDQSDGKTVEQLQAELQTCFLLAQQSGFAVVTKIEEEPVFSNFPDSPLSSRSPSVVNSPLGAPIPLRPLSIPGTPGSNAGFSPPTSPLSKRCVGKLESNLNYNRSIILAGKEAEIGDAASDPLALGPLCSLSTNT